MTYRAASEPIGSHQNICNLASDGETVPVGAIREYKYKNLTVREVALIY